jgi:hypothetical protein
MRHGGRARGSPSSVYCGLSGVWEENVDAEELAQPPVRRCGGGRDLHHGAVVCVRVKGKGFFFFATRDVGGPSGYKRRVG